MNTIGVDYGSTLTTVCLREDHSPGRVRLVGDGMSMLIPHAIADGDLWGTRALAGAGARRAGGPGSGAAPAAGGAWVDAELAPIFWRGLTGRLTAYLGRLAPVRANGYQVVVALNAADFPAMAARVGALARAAGLADTATISATDALLCRWLAEQPTQDGEVVVAALAIGDTSLLVRAYRVRVRQAGGPQILAAGPAGSLTGLGHAAWLAALLERVRARLTGASAWPVDQEIPLRDSTLAFAAQIGRTPANDPVTWDAPLWVQQRMAGPLRLSLRGCLSWPEVTRFTRPLQGLVQDAVRQLGSGSKPSMVLLGGIGALWPFAREELAGTGTIWVSQTPQEDIATGATWWPNIGERFASVLQWTTPALPPPAVPGARLGTALKPATSPVPGPRPPVKDDADDAPPWDRP